MALQFILGSSGQGKTTCLQKEFIRQAGEHPEQSFLYIVPEQFTMETQKDLVAVSPGHGILNIDVLSFVRLAYRVFGELGAADMPVLDDLGKVMILRKLLSANEQKLSYFRANIGKKGYVSELKSFLSELFQYSVSEEMLDDMLANAAGKPLLCAKLNDMKVIYASFREYLSGHFIASEEVLDILSDLAEESGLLQDATIGFDGFTGFTPSQYKLLARLLHCCKNVYITMTIDPQEDIMIPDTEHALFHLSRHTIQKLYKIAAEERIEVLPDYYPKLHENGSCHRFCNSPSLMQLEKNLFRYPVVPFKEETEDIQIHLLHNPAGEVAFTVTQILKLLKEKELRYRDIAIVTGDITTYGPVAKDAFDKAGLPYFVDQKKDILENPLVEQILSLLQLLQKNWDYESVFRYLRCPLASLSKEDVDIFENYVLACGIKGYNRYTKEWTRIPKSRVRDEETLAAGLGKVNLLREHFVEELSSIRKMARGKHTVKELTICLHDYMRQQQLYEKITAMTEKFREDNNPLAVREYEQIYTITLGILDRLVGLLGDEEVTIKEYYDLLDTGFREARVGLIPPSVDQIVIGDIERTRLSHVKVLFFLGVNDGNIPHSGGKGGILSDAERTFLAEKDFTLAPTARQAAYTEQFYLYLNLTKPSLRLYLTYSQIDAEGKTLLPSYLINRIRQIFPAIKIQVQQDIHTLLYASETDTDALLGTDEGMSGLVDGLRGYQKDEMPPAWNELYSYYKKQLVGMPSAKKSSWGNERLLDFLLKGACYHEEKSAISQAAAKMLYGDILTGSVSRLELYASCAFAHFLTYGMCLREREEFAVRMPDYGNIMHDALEIFTRRMLEEHLTWKTISNEKRRKLSDQCILEAGESYGDGMLKENHRDSYLLTRMRHMMDCTTWALSAQMQQSSFETSGYELSFYRLGGLAATELSLENDHRLSLSGRIDRLDTCEDDSHVFVKIIDYKTGDKSFEITDLYHGLQMQLIVYLDAAMELAAKEHPGKEIIPGGVYYYKLKDPIPEIPANAQADPEDITKTCQKEILSALRLDGLTNMDAPVIPLLDGNFSTGTEDLQPSTKSLVAHLETKKDGTLSSRSQTATTDTLLTYIRDTRQKMTEMGNAILNGDTAVYPYRKKDKSGCDYCPYRGICRFDSRVPGYGYHEL